MIVFLLQYGAPHGERRGNLTADHAENSTEGLVIAHKKLSEGKKYGFTVNKRVVAGDVFGMFIGAIPSFMQYVDGLGYPPGALNGGPRVLFLSTVVQLFVGTLGSSVSRLMNPIVT